MSYSCYISFKQLEADEVYEFFKQFKKAVGEHMKEIAEDNYLWVPYIRHHADIPENFKDVSRDWRTEAEFWAFRSIFSFRYFYDKELKLLGMYSVPDSIQDMFDGTVYFQNSCDQNYNKKDWKGIPSFEAIFDKWQQCPVEDVEAKYNTEHSFTSMREEYSDEEHFDAAIEYYRKTYCYEEIWKRFENTLYREEEVVYLSLYGFYDLIHVERFLKMCHTRYIGWSKE